MVEIIMSLTSEKICDCCLVSAYFVLQVQFNKYVMCQTLFGVGKKIETDAIVKKQQVNYALHEKVLNAVEKRWGCAVGVILNGWSGWASLRRWHLSKDLKEILEFSLVTIWEKNILSGQNSKGQSAKMGGWLAGLRTGNIKEGSVGEWQETRSEACGPGHFLGLLGLR